MGKKTKPHPPQVQRAPFGFTRAVYLKEEGTYTGRHFPIGDSPIGDSPIGDSPIADSPIGEPAVTYRSSAELIRNHPGQAFSLDTEVIQTYLTGGWPDPTRTIFAEIAELPPTPGSPHIDRHNGRSEAPAPDHDLRPSAPQDHNTAPITADRLHDILRDETIALATYPRLALAMSAGLDCALVLAWYLASGATDIPIYTLAPTLGEGAQAYNEAEGAMASVAHVFQAHQRATPTQHVLVRATPLDFIRAVPSSIEAIEVPLYNLHPIGKGILAKAMENDGIERCLSGDGADQVVRCDLSANYLPLAQALFADHTVELTSPFLTSAGASALASATVDTRNKGVLRTIAKRLGVHPEVACAEKKTRLAPDLLRLRGIEAGEQVNMVERAMEQRALEKLADRFAMDRAWLAKCRTNAALHTRWVTTRILVDWADRLILEH